MKEATRDAIRQLRALAVDCEHLQKLMAQAPALGGLVIGAHAYRLAFDRLAEARALFEAAAALEEANA